MFDALRTAELESELVGLAGRIAARQCRFLLLLAEFDAREGWAGPGIRSCAHWLSWRVGLGRRAGREQVRVAKALVALPMIAEAFGAGRLSFAKVRAITRIANVDNAQALLDLALAGTAEHVERVVREARSAATSGRAFAAGRSASWRWDPDGYLVLRAKLPPEAGALLVAALRSAGSTAGGEHLERPPDGAGGGSAEPRSRRVRGQLGREHPPGEAVDRAAARRADALLELLAPDSGRHELVVHLEATTALTTISQATAGEATVGEATAGEATIGEARLEGGPPIAASTAARIACDARVRALLTDRHGNPLYLGRRHRAVTETQRAALLIRDRHRCRYPGCEHRRYLHAHHITHWLHGGRTDVDNLVMLCAFHHRLVHDHGYRGALAGTRFRVWRPDGSEVTAQCPPTDKHSLDRLDWFIESHVDTIADEAIVPTWGGERLDIDAVLAAVLPSIEADVA